MTEAQRLDRWAEDAGSGDEDRMEREARAVGNIKAARRWPSKLAVERNQGLRSPRTHPPR